MKLSERLVSVSIIMALLLMTSSILLLIANNRHLFAQIRVLNHGRASIISEKATIQNVGYSNPKL